MTFDSDERSIAGSRPIDLFTIATPTVTYRLTSHIVDVVFGGNVFVATTMSRGSSTIARDLTGKELIVYLPITHPLVQRYAASGLPEHGVVITHHRLQESSGVAMQAWVGFGNSLSVDGHVATVRVPSITDDAMKIKLPVVGAQKLCNHVLFDARCTSSRSGHRFDLAILSVTGTTVVVASLSAADGVCDFGELVHVSSGQARMTLQQIGTTFRLNAPIVGAAPGDAIQAFWGCDHAIQTCRDKFDNVINFGGMPDLNGTVNPWAPAGFGIVQQT